MSNGQRIIDGLSEALEHAKDAQMTDTLVEPTQLHTWEKAKARIEEQAGEIVGLKAKLHMVLDREADTQCRHDAKVEALEAEIERLLEQIDNIRALAAKRQAEGGPDMTLLHIEGFASAALAGKAEQ